MENLKSFTGDLYPVNPKRNSVLGLKAFPRIGEVPGPVDLGVIATPAIAVPDVVSECAQAGVKGAVIISAGFRECGAVGVQLEEAILARRGCMRLIGPNCLGVMIPGQGLNATFAKKMALPGNVAFISQSGALCTSILDWSLREKVGFSAFLSVGSMLDVGWGDLIFYLADDLDTRSILIYMESIGDARAFLSAAREVALRKPIIVIKVGRTEAAAHAVASHTGTLTGSDDVLETAFRRIGVLRVSTISDLFNMAEVLSRIDPQFGPILLFGAGGQLVEVIQDYVLGLPPLNGTLARRMMEQTRVYAALKGVRGRAPVDLPDLETLLVHFSLLVAEQRWIKEIDVNPLLASPKQLLVLDARIILHDPELSENQLPRLAIRPYPGQYVTQWKLRDGPLTIRPIRPEDEPLMVKFHGTLSEESVHFRYFGIVKLEQRVAHERLTRICFNDYDREIAMVATSQTTNEEEILGVGRLIKVHGVNEAHCVARPATHDPEHV